MVHLDGLRRKRVVVLPDLFVDVLVPLPRWEQAAAAMEAVAQRGGGNVPVAAMEFRAGGNAANLALALARQGAHVELIARTDALGRHVIEAAAQGTRLGLGHVKTDGQASSTVALECEDANVMLSHAGPVAEFGPDHLDDADWAAIESADAVAVVNWSQNCAGTPLLQEVGRRAAGMVYLDTGDPRHRADATHLLDAGVWRHIHAWGLNENELHAFSGGRDVPSAQRLAARLGTRLDLHTRTMAASVTGDQAVEVAAETTPARRLTGAGDAWNAGNLAGYLLELPDDDRLRLAHRTATRHVTGPMAAI